MPPVHVLASLITLLGRPVFVWLNIITLPIPARLAEQAVRPLTTNLMIMSFLAWVYTTFCAQWPFLHAKVYHMWQEASSRGLFCLSGASTRWDPCREGWRGLPSVGGGSLAGTLYASA